MSQTAEGNDRVISKRHQAVWSVNRRQPAINAARVAGEESLGVLVR